MTTKLIIPATGAQYPDETFDVNLSGNRYTFRFTYNFRFGFWEMSITQNGVTFFNRVKIVSGINLGEVLVPAQYGLTGVFYVYSLKADTNDPTFNDFGVGQDKNVVYEF